MNVFSCDKKKFIAATGFALILAVVIYLAGNLLVFFGPAAFNGYVNKMTTLRPLFQVIEMVLLVVFFLHLWLAASFALENWRVRPPGYQAVRLMPWAGAAVAAFALWQIADFLAIDASGPGSILPDGNSYGAFGVLYNFLDDPIHCILYAVAMIAVGTRLSHEIRNFVQAFAANSLGYAPTLRVVSSGIGIAVAFVYGAVPVYVQLSFGMFK